LNAVFIEQLSLKLTFLGITLLLY